MQIRRVRAYVVEQYPHPMFGPAPFVAVVFEDGFLKWDRRRIKRETMRAMNVWRKEKIGGKRTDRDSNLDASH